MRPLPLPWEPAARAQLLQPALSRRLVLRSLVLVRVPVELVSVVRAQGPYPQMERSRERVPAAQGPAERALAVQAPVASLSAAQARPLRQVLWQA